MPFFSLYLFMLSLIVFVVWPRRRRSPRDTHDQPASVSFLSLAFHPDRRQSIDQFRCMICQFRRVWFVNFVVWFVNFVDFAVIVCENGCFGESLKLLLLLSTEQFKWLLNSDPNDTPSKKVRLQTILTVQFFFECRSPTVRSDSFVCKPFSESFGSSQKGRAPWFVGLLIYYSAFRLTTLVKCVKKFFRFVLASESMM